ncbi:hypothetical protein MF265_01480 [Serratia marcescens]|uniref:RHS repeat domain-containing protein n=1 Tax=Serratia marcescens TaxID=615 RepID=UPI001EEFC465|nr:RHS repeat-associated core domain-containing protein [Serratia marcescens]ULH11495.1 hypothetical protein MF265_01480 [Serratia marcescens]
MSTQPSFFTQAVNFISTVAGGVDPRTGLYNVTLSLAKLSGNRGMGPEFPVSLKYSPLAALNHISTGLGEGFTLGLSAYNRTTGELTLSTGEHYRVVEEAEAVFLQQKKLDNVRFEKDTVNNHYRVIHRNGDIELLQGADTGFDIKMPVRLMTAAGHALTLSRDTQNRLISVADDDGILLLTLSYPDDISAATRMHLYPDTDEGYEVELIFLNDRLTTLRSYALPDTPLEWSLEYTAMSPDVWGVWLTGVTGPAGAREEAIYRQDGQGNAFPAEAGPGYPALPYVTLYRHTSGGRQPTTEVQYSYTAHNFLGYESGNPDWQPNQDNLYNCPYYIYGSTETQASGDELRTVTRTYNNFHLQIQEKTCQGGTCKTQETTYYAQAGERFAAQPAQYQLPKTQTVTWENETEHTSETTQTTFDTAGNLLTRETPDGILTTCDYYPPDGSGADCPPEPNGFTRFMKSVTVTPAKTGTAWRDVPVSRTLYRYAPCVPVPGTVRGLVMKSGERHYSDETLLQTVDCQYETTAVEYAGQLVSRTSRHYPAGEAGGGYTTLETFTLKDEAGVLIKKHTVLTADSLSLRSEDRISRYTGYLLRSEDTQGNIVLYEYDRLGRQTQRTQHPGTVYENTWLYQYDLDPQAELPLSVTTTDPLNNQQREGMDGTGRRIRRETREAGSTVWRVTGRQAYDLLGRSAEDSVMDWLSPVENQNTDNSLMTLTGTRLYDGWGQSRGTQFSDGTTTRASYDPLTRQSTAVISGGNVSSGRKVTTLNAGGRPVEVSLYPVDGATAYSTRRLQYDGLGRLRQETDALGHNTQYDYDAWGRLTLTTLPDNTTVTRRYADNSAGTLLAGIAVNGHILGHQTFDGLGRLLTRASGGRTWQYSYTLPADTRPAVEVAPDGVTRQYTYQRELGEALTSVQAGEITQSFSYNPTTRALLQSREGTVRLQYDYLPSGHLQSTRAVYGLIPARRQSQTYTLLGLSHTVTDWSGETVTREYDTHGWLSTLRDSTLLMQLRYDGARRLTGWRVSSLLSDYWQDTALTLDDFGREVQRVLTDSQHLTLAVSRTWDPGDRLTGLRTCRRDEVLRDETYRYDSRGRLTDYTCTGSEPPEDEFGGVSRQQFCYDAAGNVTWRESRYTDGSVNRSHFFYQNKNDICQLTTVTHSHPAFAKKLTFTRDAAGRMTVDEAGRQREYDALGRLCSLTCNGATTRYQYDAGNRLVQEADTALYYLDDRLNTQASARGSIRLVTVGGQAVAQVRTDGSQNRDVWLTGTDGAGSILLADNGSRQEYHAYTPYGESPTAGMPVLRFRGERGDPVSGHYHLGNGYRTYSPALMQFLSPDSLSPFGAGGINSYAYCGADPVNRSDPGGHFSLDWRGWMGLAGGVMSLLAVVITAGLAVVAAGGVIAAMASASTTSLLLGAVGGISDTLSIASSIASGFSNSGAARVLGNISASLGLVGTAAALGLLLFKFYRASQALIQARQDTDDLRSMIAHRGSQSAMSGRESIPESELAEMRSRVNTQDFDMEYQRERSQTLPSSLMPRRPDVEPGSFEEEPIPHTDRPEPGSSGTQGLSGRVSAATPHRPSTPRPEPENGSVGSETGRSALERPLRDLRRGSSDSS